MATQEERLEAIRMVLLDAERQADTSGDTALGQRCFDAQRDLRRIQDDLIRRDKTH